MKNIDNNKYEIYRKYISILIFIEIFNPLLTFLFMMMLSCINKIIPVLNDVPGYGYGVLSIISMAASILFGIPALICNWTLISTLKENKDTSSIFKILCFLLAPAVIHWIVLIVGTIFKLL